MINIAVFAKDMITIESDDYGIKDRDDMIKFLSTLLDKVAFSGERFCLEAADINDDGSASPTVEYIEIKRWGILIMTGQVKTLMQEKGFGFIRGTDGKEYFFHNSTCLDDFLDMTNGTKVEFDIVPSPKGPRAENVKLAV